MLCAYAASVCVNLIIVVCCVSLDLRFFDEHLNRQRNPTALVTWCFHFCGIYIVLLFSHIHTTIHYFTFDSSLDSNRTNETCGYLYGQLDCWLTINRRRMILCHYQKVCSNCVQLVVYYCKPGDVFAHKS